MNRRAIMRSFLVAAAAAGTGRNAVAKTPQDEVRDIVERLADLSLSREDASDVTLLATGLTDAHPYRKIIVPMLEAGHSPREINRHIAEMHEAEYRAKYEKRHGHPPDHKMYVRDD